MRIIPDIIPDDSCLRLADLTLFPGRHYQHSSRGIILHKSGHDQIRAHILRSEDRGASVGSLVEAILTIRDFSEETFDLSSRPGSIFRSISQKCLKLVPGSCKAALRRHLHGHNAVVSMRAARLLMHIYETAESYPDLDIFLNCYFRVESMSVDKFAKFAKKRLLEADGDIASEFNDLKRGIDQFATEFRPHVGTMGIRKANDLAEFSAALLALIHKLDRLCAKLAFLRDVHESIKPLDVGPIDYTG